MASPPDLGIDGIGDLAPLESGDPSIYRAREARDHRLVAIRILDTRRAPLLPRRRLDLRRSPLHEFALTDGVVPVLRTGRTSGGDRYLMMPYYPAGSLADQLAHGSAPWFASTELIAQIAGIVARGHLDDVVLTGIEPARILLADANTPLLAVYGMATRRIDDARPSYRAPELDDREQDRDQPTPQADVFSLGLTLAALIVGRPPTGTAHRDLIADVEALAPGRIFDVIAKATEERPSDRHHSAGELAVSLQATIGRDRGADRAPGGRAALDFDLDAMLAAPATTAPAGSAGPVPSPADADRLVRRTPPPLPPQREAHGQNGRPQDGGGEDGRVDGGTIDGCTIDGGPVAGDDIVINLVDDEIERGRDDRPPAHEPPPPILAPPVDPLGLVDHDDLPFRPPDRQPVTHDTSRFAHLLDPLLMTWLQLRRSLGALVAIIALLVVAGIVATVVLQQRQASQTGSGVIVTATTPIDEAPPFTFGATSIAPAFLEPPATHRNAVEAGLTPPTVTRSDPTSQEVVRPRPTPSSAVEAVQPRAGAPADDLAVATASSRPPAGSVSATALTPAPAGPVATAATVARRSGTAPTGPTTAVSVTTADTERLAISVAAVRLRQTSARIVVTSPSCVTTDFTYSAIAAGGREHLSGGSRCSTSHTLNLGQVTAALRPGTAYTVWVTAADQLGRSVTSQVSFTTLP